MSIPVLALPAFDPGAQRIALDAPEGLTVAQIVALALPAGAFAVSRVRVVLVSPRGETVLAPEISWHRVKPRAGITVVIRVVPAGDDLRNALLIAVSIAAVALGQVWAPALAGTFGLSAATWGTLITTGVTLVGSALVNWLIPPAATASEKPTYAIAAWQNPLTPNGRVPAVLGRHRYAPPYAVKPYIEIVGDDMYLRGAFLVGYGPLVLSDLRLGDTPLGSFDEVETENRYGYADDAPLTITPQQVIEEQIGAELTRPLPRDDLGDIIEGGISVATPVSRLSAGDVTEGCLILNFPGGLVRFNSDGDAKPRTVDIQMRYRLVGSVSWTTEDLSFTGDSREGSFRAYRFSFPSRGRWEVELTRVTDEATDSNISDRTVWFALQSFRPEYPISFTEPVSLVGLRIKATHQLNGTIDTFNLIASRIAPDWNGSEWVAGETRNPAAAMRFVLAAVANAFPDLQAIVAGELEDWHEFCAAKNLKYDRVHDFDASLQDVLTDIARAGRASPRRDGNKWGVVIDRPKTTVVAHLNERNARDFRVSRAYLEPPAGVRVSFLDETADYQSRERIIPWPGTPGTSPEEELSMPGKTDPEEIYIEAYRHMLAVQARTDRFSAVQDGAVRTATRGDLVKANIESISTTQTTLRVKSVHGQLVELDGTVHMEAGAYACRFFVDSGGEAVSVFRTVRPATGEHGAILLNGTGTVPPVGTLLQFGTLASDSFELVIASVEAGDGNTSVIQAVAAAPEIDALVDALVVPAWDGRVGEIPGAVDTPPALPRIVSAATHYTSGVADGIMVLLAPGLGSGIIVARYEVQHRLSGSGTWLGPASAPAGSGAVVVTGYSSDDIVEFEYRAVSLAGVVSEWSAAAEETVDAPPLIIPSASATAGLGSLSIALTAPAANVDKVRLYIGATNVFADAALAQERDADPNASYTLAAGDASRVNMVPNSAFNNATGVTLGTGWSVAAGLASKTAGTASELLETLSPAPVNGKQYNYSFDLVRSAGTLEFWLYPSPYVFGASFTSSGFKSGTVTSANSMTQVGPFGSNTFVGSIDNLSVYEKTAACLTQGTLYVWVTAVNAEGIEGPELALGAVTIR